MESSTERWIQLTVRDQTIPDKHGEILLKLSEVKSIVSNFERNQFEFAELCLSDNKYFIDQEMKSRGRSKRSLRLSSSR